LDARVPNVHRFSNGEKSPNDEYRFNWAYGLQLIGEWLRDDGTFTHGKLYEELKVAAGVIQFSERDLSSRGKVIEATSKDKLKAELGRSPDYLDALLMSLVAKHGENPSNDVPLAW